MEPLTISGLLAGGANLLGSVFSSDTSAKNTQAQIQASEQQQQVQNAFTQQMSSTAYQRASSDMKAAGLNPAMMFGSGSAASTPGGSSIQAPMPQTTSKFAGLGTAVNTALSGMIQQKTLDKMTDEIANLKATREKTVADTATELQRPPLVAAQVASEAKRSGLIAAETTAQSARAGLTAEEARNEEIRRQIIGNDATRALHERELREAMPWIDKAALLGKNTSEVIAPFVSSANTARRFMLNRMFY